MNKHIAIVSIIGAMATAASAQTAMQPTAPHDSYQAQGSGTT
jgi:hypothetical protein